MRRLALAALLSAVLAASSAAEPVDVYVVTDDGRRLPSYQVSPTGVYGQRTFRYYVEARYGDRYSVVVRNDTGSRVGAVIAVDGRNAISGKRSELRPDERMYVVGPYRTESFDGWRTGQDRVNRFYFTDPGDSYSAAFGDYSAMGVIAVAVFREVPPPPMPPPHVMEPHMERGPSPGAGTMGSASPRQKSLRGPAEDSMGTGYGEERYSPSERVEFLPEPRPLARVFLKYETRESLCRKGIVDCRWPPNRFWDDDDDFAPPPPPRRR